MTSFSYTIKSGGKGSARNHADYIAREGKHRRRGDLVWTQYGNMPEWAECDPASFWRAADQYERVNGAVFREHTTPLPNELTPEQRKELASSIVASITRNKPYQAAIHDPISSLEGVSNPHLHVMYSDRMPDGIERPPEQMFRRYNGKHPERGGCRKDSGGKNRLELRDEVIETRKKCADLQNAALMKYGHTARVDHRTLKEQGINRTPERHLGPARIRNMSQEEKERYVAARAEGRTNEE